MAEFDAGLLQINRTTERLWIPDTPITPRCEERRAGEWGVRRGYDIGICLVAEVRVNVRRDAAPICRSVGDQHVGGRARRLRIDGHGYN